MKFLQSQRSSRWPALLGALLLCHAPMVLAEAPSSDSSEIDVLSHGVAQDRLFGVAFDGDFGIAVGQAGIAKISKDGGKTWTAEQVPTELALLGVSISKGSAIAVGQQGLVMRRSASGAWSTAGQPTRERLLGVDSNDKGLAVAVGAFGTVLVSKDGGANWANAAPNWMDVAKIAGRENDRTGAVNEPTMFAVKVFESGKILIGGELAYVLKSDDGSSSWSLVYQAPTGVDVVAPTVHSINVRDDGVGFAVGQEGQVLKTTDGGNSWAVRSTPIGNGNLLAVDSTGSGAVVALGMRVAVRSSNDGETWQVADGGDFSVNWYSDVESIGNALVGVGHSGRIISIK